MKFKFIPKWATYIAYDNEIKGWFAFEFRPNLSESSWIYEGKREEEFPELLTTLGPVKRR